MSADQVLRSTIVRILLNFTYAELALHYFNIFGLWLACGVFPVQPFITVPY
jgi:hypothetical protein